MSRLLSTSSLVPRAFIDELLRLTDLVELIDSYVPLKKRGNSFLACCPFHNEKNPSFNVIPKKQFYHCFGCGANGNAISFVMNFLNQTFPDALQTLASRQGLQVPRENHNPQKIAQSLSLYQILQNAGQFYEKNLITSGKPAISYLQQRGLTGHIAKRFQLGFAVDGWNALENQFRSHKKELIESGMLIQKDDGKTYDRFRHRVMFPIHDRQGRIIGFGGRAIDDTQKPKYLNSPETILFQKNRELYGLYQILQTTPSPSFILIVEGYLDVIALAQFDVSNAVATLGTATSRSHIQLLAKHSKELVFCFDGDEAGKKAAWRALENSLPHLENGLDIRFMFLPEKQDPDSFIRSQGKDAFLTFIANALPLHRYLLDTLKQNLDMQSVAGKSRLVDACLPLLKLIPEGAYKQLLIDELSRLSHIENHRLSHMINLQQFSITPEKAFAKPLRRTPIRIAISLLLQNPEIYTQCKDKISIDALDGKGHDILQTLLRQIEHNPHINTANLIELWRNSPLFESLGKLAGWDLHVPVNTQHHEFMDILHFLQKQNIENKIGELMAKLTNQGLTDEERITLRDLQKKIKSRA